ncbi:MAG: hypothetical protein Q3972_07310 [Corynebacterium sp.]|nr:hypothetical protein [Corynebacterium sp.]
MGVEEFTKIMVLDNGPEIVRQCARYCFKDTKLMFRIWGREEARNFLPGVVGDGFDKKINRFHPDVYRELLNAPYRDLETLMAKEYGTQLDRTPDKNTIASTLIGLMRDHSAAQLMRSGEAMFVIDSPSHLVRNTGGTPFSFELEVTALEPAKKHLDPAVLFPPRLKPREVGTKFTYGFNFYYGTLEDMMQAYNTCLNLYDLIGERAEAYAEIIKSWELPECFLLHLFWTPTGTIGQGPFELRIGMIMALAEQAWLSGRIPEQRDVDFLYWAILNNVGNCMHPGHLVWSHNLWWILARCFATIGIDRWHRPNSKPLPSLSRMRQTDEKIIAKKKCCAFH